MNVTMPRLIAAYITGAAVAVGITMAGIFGIPAAANTMASEPTQALQQIQEDDPGWDCRSRGNHVCGVTGQDNVVYQVHYDGNGFVDWVQPRHIPAS